MGEHEHLVLAVRPDDPVELRQQRGAALRIGEQQHGATAGSQQSHETVVRLRSQLVQLERRLGHHRLAFLRLRAILFLDAHLL